MNFTLNPNDWRVVRLIQLSGLVTALGTGIFWLFMALFGIPFVAQEVLGVGIESALVIGIFLVAVVPKPTS